MFEQLIFINQKMYRSILMALLAGTLSSCDFAKGKTIDSNSNSIEDAHNAYFQMDHATAYSIYTNVWNDTTQTVEDRNDAGQFVAKMDWLFYKNATEALKTIDLIEKLDYEPTKLFTLKARILADQSGF